jgi:type III secretory pathway component EscV
MESNEKDPTNWKAWYWGLILFLVVQIVVYLVITKAYEA